jgi:hypothetical protein
LADLAASLLLSLTFLLQTLKATSLPAPLFTGRFENRKPDCLADLAASLLLGHFANPKRMSLSAPLLPGIFSLPVLKGVNPICFGRFSSKPFTQPNIHPTKPKAT